MINTHFLWINTGHLLKWVVSLVTVKHQIHWSECRSLPLIYWFVGCVSWNRKWFSFFCHKQAHLEATCSEYQSSILFIISVRACWIPLSSNVCTIWGKITALPTQQYFLFQFHSVTKNIRKHVLRQRVWRLWRDWILIYATHFALLKLITFFWLIYQNNFLMNIFIFIQVQCSFTRALKIVELVWWS